MILPALATTVMMFFVLVLLQLADRAIVPRSSSSTQHLQIESPSVSGHFIATIYDICTRNKISIEKLHLHAEKEGEALELIRRIPSEGTLTKVIGEMRTLPAVIAIHTNLDSTNVESSTSDVSTK